MIQRLRVRNFRGHRSLELPLEPTVVLLGPNAAGKTTALDALSFLRDWAINGGEEASSRRDQGIGLRFDGAGEGEAIEVGVETTLATYTAKIVLANGRLDPYFGETLTRKVDGVELMRRLPGQQTVQFLLDGQLLERKLQAPDRPGLSTYSAVLNVPEAAVESISSALGRIYSYPSRSFNFWALRTRGSEVSLGSRFLSTNAGNLWVVLRRLNDRRAVDPRLDTILRYMREAFPRFRDILLEQTAPNVVIGSFVEAGRRAPIPASAASDGYLQLLILLTALFSQDEPHLVLFDEPETALHPWATGVLANAMREAADSTWQRQILVASHHAALLSQVDLATIWEIGAGSEGETRVERVCENPALAELLEQYSLGSLYLAGTLAEQQPRD